MESKEGKKFNYKIGGIFAIAVVAAIVGTLAITSFQTNSDSNTQTQSIGIGAYVTVEAYHEDGTLFQKWEGHNALDNRARNALVGCITGLGTTPPGFLTCNLNVSEMTIFELPQDGSSQIFHNEIAVITLKPDLCDVNEADNLCTGWEMKSIFDYDTLSCTSGVDCLDVVAAGAASTTTTNFNTVPITPVIAIEPNDRLVVTMIFDIPA